MVDQYMNSTDRARRILDAWERMDLAGLDGELAQAEFDGDAVADASCEEQERQDLLSSIALQMRQNLSCLAAISDAEEETAICFRLLRHLAETGKGAAIRSEKLFFFPYSQSGRRISACH
jgi:hypothetical protein